MRNLTNSDIVGYGIGTFFSVTTIFYAVYFPLGLFTGIFGMCAVAPDWWIEIYNELFWLIPLIGIISASAVIFWLNRKSLEQI